MTFSSGLRMCLLKFKLFFDDGRPLFSRGMPAIIIKDFRGCMASQSASFHKQVIERICGPHYTEPPHAKAQMFLDDVVVLAAEHPDDLHKKTGKSVKVMYGTTRNEAFHLELKSFFRNIHGVRARRAQLIGEVWKNRQCVSRISASIS